MKPPLDNQKDQIRKPSTHRPPNFKLIIALACLGVGTGLFLPVIKTTLGRHHRMPPGQLLADAKTFVAQVRYFFTPETDSVEFPVRHDTNLANLGQPLPVRTLDGNDFFYGQAKSIPKPSTNPPSQS